MVAVEHSQRIKDAHSFSNPHEIKIAHLSLDLDVLFDERVISGTVILKLANPSIEYACPLILDTMDLSVINVMAKSEESRFEPVSFQMGSRDPVLGSPLSIELPDRTTQVRVKYSSNPNSAAIQWLDPRQTASKKAPFVYTQSQSIFARSWIPVQDSPQVRTTYDARIRTPQRMLALMSADNNDPTRRTGSYAFNMVRPIPSYLIALAVGDLEYARLGERSGVYAEPSVVGFASTEFKDIEKMICVAERLYGPYRWNRYDVLVLPPSFPYGGMENPELSFVTPTVLAGDKSLVSVVAHELAHSWSGNLVTNATWEDFWLNEGFTVYVERRILEEVYGSEQAAMESTLGAMALRQEMKTLDERDEIMHIELNGRSPEDAFTEVPYEKGALFLKHLERVLGRRRFDSFLRRYFDHFAFRSITTSRFVSYINANLLDAEPGLAAEIALNEWLFEPGIPRNAPRSRSRAFANIEAMTNAWLEGTVATESIGAKRWTTQEWLYFLRFLPEKLPQDRMRKLDMTYHLTESTNSELVSQWLLTAIRNSYEPAYRRLGEFLRSVGRLKFLKPLYEELVKTPAGKIRALNIYKEARRGYHPIAAASVDQIINRSEA